MWWMEKEYAVAKANGSREGVDRKSLCGKGKEIREVRSKRNYVTLGRRNVQMCAGQVVAGVGVPYTSFIVRRTGDL